MADSKMHEEKTIYLPKEIVEASDGFAVDIGGSMAKIVYRSKKDYRNGKFVGEKDPKCPPGMGPLHSTQFPKADIDAYCAFLKENCDIISGGTIYATGTGGSQYQDKLEGLGIKLQMLSEFSCFSKSLNIMLEKFVKGDWVHEINEKGLKDGLQHLWSHRLMQDLTAGKPVMSEEEFKKVYLSQVEAYVERYKEERKHLAGCHYPYLMVLCGSAFGFIKVERDGSCQMIDFNMLSGRFFLGLGTILSEEKDYAKLIKMCEEYDGSSIDIKGKDLLSDKPDEQEDLYSKLKPEARIFPFGKGHDIEPGSAKKGDFISSLMQSICDNLAFATFHVGREHNLRHAYFCGGFVGQEIVRRHITAGMACRSLCVPSGTRTHAHFVSNASHLGAIGAFVSGHTDEGAAKTRVKRSC